MRKYREKEGIKFQFTPLREGRPVTVPDGWMAYSFQFTPLREGRRVLVTMCIIHRSISIHAPPRGATCVGYDVHYTSVDFNSRPSARGDRAASGVLDHRQRFQFTPLREGRPRFLSPVRPAMRISIHAPPRGATAKDMQFLQIFCSTLTNQHGLTTVPRNLSRLF